MGHTQILASLANPPRIEGPLLKLPRGRRVRNTRNGREGTVDESGYTDPNNNPFAYVRYDDADDQRELEKRPKRDLELVED